MPQRWVDVPWQAAGLNPAAQWLSVMRFEWRADGHSAVDLKDLAGGVGDVAADEGGDCAGDVFGFAPAAFEGQAVGDEAFVFFGDAGGHVTADDAGLDFVDGDIELGEAGRPQPVAMRVAALERQ